jgi:hypothetical protein
MVESHDELITDITKEIGLDRMGEDVEQEEEEDEDDDDGGDTAAPPTAMPPLDPMPLVATAPEEVIVEEDPIEMVLEQEAPVAHEVILVDAEPELCSPTSTALRMMDDLDDLDDRPKPALTWMSGFPGMEAMIGIK